MLTTEK